MTVLFAASAVEGRRRAAEGGLRELADSLAADLAPVAARELWLPREKARLTRRGGWCERDGTRLDFDPLAPHAHRCPRCGTVYAGDDHYRWWVMGYQLWLAERAVHGAALALVAGREELGAFADRVLAAYADAYLAYPNADNVLGPTRPFFSTYLESIWLLQLCVALSLREMAGATGGAGAVRDRVIEPSARLIASYDEGASNRQVWNNAALLAAGASLGTAAYDAAFDGRTGVLAHLYGGLLADGSWYEGENYHLFAHRGLWYGAELAARRGASLPAEAARRLDAGFVSPFLTALPDFTFPARRDSAYAVSLRQWRFAELAELGVARRPTPELLGALGTLYDPRVPRAATERARSTAEAERNAPASGLSRADLGWRSLLFAPEHLPDAPPWSPGSVLLPAQGLAVLRRCGGGLYAALDYGASGGGHGHPDRLNLLLSDGAVRWQDDVGTGSYTEPELHWYRSTLAHGAPLVDGVSQLRVDGALLDYDERGDYALVRAAAAIAPALVAVRTLVVCPEYVIAVLDWHSNGGRRVVDLPVHVDGSTSAGPWTAGVLQGGSGTDDGFGFLSDAAWAPLPGGEVVRIEARAGAGDSTADADLWLLASADSELWRAFAPGPPGSGARRRMHLLRASATSGRMVQLWSTRGAVADVERDGERLVVRLRDGSVDTHGESTDEGGGWLVRRVRESDATLGSAGEAGAVESVVRLAGREPTPRSAERNPTAGPVTEPATNPGAHSAARGAPPQQHDASESTPEHHRAPAPRTATTRRLPPAPSLGTTPHSLTLGEPHYRRSESSWAEAGRPTARVTLRVDAGALLVTVAVTKPDPLHAPVPPAENPLDNEHPDTNADGVQLYVALPDAAAGERLLAWLAVPAPDEPSVRVTPLTPEAAAARLTAGWRAMPGGYALAFALHGVPAGALALDVVINETSPARERRRGQLVLSGGAGEFVYLRGTRQPRERFLPFTVPHV